MKAGQVILKSGVMRTKQKKWCVFLNKIEDGQILEFFDSAEDAKKNSKHKKVFILKQVKSMDFVNKSSTKDFYVNIHMKKERLTLCFDNEADFDDWSQYLQTYVSTVSADGGSGAYVGDEVEEGSVKRNMLYEASEDTIRFDVNMERTPASDKNHLEPGKPYTLLVTMTNLALEDPAENENPILFRWMYEYIRSYGKKGDNFTIYAGRKCETGEGEFSFHVGNPKSIEQAIDLQTRRKLAFRTQHSRHDDMPVTAEDLRLSGSSKRPVSTPTGTYETEQLRSSVKAAASEKFQKELNTNLATRLTPGSEKTKSSSKKEDKKGGGFHLFGKKKDSKKEHENETHEEKIAEKVKNLSFDEHIYDEAVAPQVLSKDLLGREMYSHVKSIPGSWETHGQRTSEVHVENYRNLSLAGKENKGKKLPPPPPTDDDDMYDTLGPKGGMKPQKQNEEEGEEESVYGIASGMLLVGDFMEDEVYDDTVSVKKVHSDLDAACLYETVDFQH